MNFAVEDLQGTLMRLLQMGAVMDGPVQYPTQGQVRLGWFLLKGAVFEGGACRWRLLEGRMAT